MPQPSEEGVTEAQRVSEAVHADALPDPRPALLTKVYSSPLNFVVIRASATTHVRPSPVAPQTGVLRSGDVVSGWRQGTWATPGGVGEDAPGPPP